MIIISNKPGQLGNLLIVYSNFLALGLDQGTKIINPAFHEYRRYFAGSRKTLPLGKVFYKICLHASTIFRKINLNTRFVAVKHIDLDEQINLDEEGKLFDSAKLYFIQGWLYRGNTMLSKHQAAVKAFFRPTLQIEKSIDKFFVQNFIDSDEVIIGVHIRRGDYKEFQNGKYFYSISQYEAVMERLTKLFDSDKLHFLICSNEKLMHGDFRKTNLKMTLAPNNQLIDMYCLSRCHYIVGPPSTYSMWASFYGSVPLAMISDIYTLIELSDFKIQQEF